MHVRNFQIVHGEKIAEDDPVLVDRARQMRTDAPVRDQPLVTRRGRGHILPRTVSHLLKNAQHSIRVSNINDEKHNQITQGQTHSPVPGLEEPRARVATTGYAPSSRTVPLKTVRTPSAVLTRKNPRSSNPSVTPARPPFSLIVTFAPRTDEELTSNRRRIAPRAPSSSTRLRYSRSSAFSRAPQSSTRDHSVPVAIRNEVAISRR